MSEDFLTLIQKPEFSVMCVPLYFSIIHIWILVKSYLRGAMKEVMVQIFYCKALPDRPV